MRTVYTIYIQDVFYAYILGLFIIDLIEIILSFQLIAKSLIVN